MTETAQTPQEPDVRKSQRQIAFGCGAALLSILLFGVIPLFTPGLRYQYSQMPFDAQQWRDAKPPTQSTPRLYMVEDLLRQNILIGQTREQVEQLLGPGDDVRSFDGYQRVYWLGPSPKPLSLASVYLLLKFDETDKVIEATQIAA